ncbi:MAG: M23 family metallopeptidase [Roseburia sp.]|nr:M23 family metallopeptidase [Roseburia sp.]MCM1097950.1 M23 family metallopeptidase [Ruminococcus flavefaciens]
MRRNRNNSGKKERIIMLASSAFVLTALTMTGIYMQARNEESKDDGYMLDFTTLEDNAANKYQEIAENGLQAEEPDSAPQSWGTTGSDLALLPENPEDDLDYMPLEAGSGRIELPGLTDEALERQENEAAEDHETVLPGSSDLTGQTLEQEAQAATEAAGTGVSGLADGALEPQEQGTVQSGQADEILEPQAAEPAIVQPGLTEGAAEAQEPAETSARELHFAESEGLRRPVEGEVLIPFSMDGSVYFSTLDQYKYNPAMMLVAQEGTVVLACAEGQVVDIFENAEIGRAVTMDLGDGYRITYGQLKDITVGLGSYVNPGEVIGAVAAPTKYYSIEGANLYLKLTANGTPVNPEALFQ